MEESEEIKHRKLFEKITKRGPEAFDKLLMVCNESGYQEAHKILKPTGSYTECHSIRDSTTENRPRIQEYMDVRLEPYTEPINAQYTVNVVNSTSINSHPIIQCYNMYSQKRGVFFFVNNTSIGDSERVTANMDKNYLISLFRGLGFTIFYYENILLKNLVELIDQLIVSEYLKKVDSFVFAILSDGYTYKKKTILQFPDHTERANFFLKKFNNQYCHHLINTPKIFIFPMCKERYGWEKPLETNEINIGLNTNGHSSTVHEGVKLAYNPPTYSDMLYFYIDLGTMTNLILVEVVKKKLLIFLYRLQKFIYKLHNCYV